MTDIETSHALSVADATVEALTDQLILDEIKMLETMTRQTVGQAIRVGELLNRKKEALPHGEFDKWVAKTLPIQRTYAHRLRKLADNASFVEANPRTCDTVKGALREIDKIAKGNGAPPEPKPVDLVAKALKYWLAMSDEDRDRFLGEINATYIVASHVRRDDTDFDAAAPKTIEGEAVEVEAKPEPNTEKPAKAAVAKKAKPKAKAVKANGGKPPKAEPEADDPDADDVNALHEKLTAGRRKPSASARA